jgi:hypothetical protein
MYYYQDPIGDAGFSGFQPDVGAWGAGGGFNLGQLLQQVFQMIQQGGFGGQKSPMDMARAQPQQMGASQSYGGLFGQFPGLGQMSGYSQPQSGLFANFPGLGQMSGWGAPSQPPLPNIGTPPGGPNMHIPEQQQPTGTSPMNMARSGISSPFQTY